MMCPRGLFSKYSRTIALVLAVNCFVLWPSSSGDLFPTPQFSGDDVTSKVFGSENTSDLFPVAYGDFNADKLTDVIAVTNDRRSIVLFFAYEEAPFLRVGKICDLRTDKDDPENQIYVIGAAPGDFTGDGVMDLLVTFGWRMRKNKEVIIFKGNSKDLVCHNRMGKTIEVVQEPLVVDLNGDMIMDLVGEQYVKPKEDSSHSLERKKMVWLFHEDSVNITYSEYDFDIVRSKEQEKWESHDMASPSSNAFVDLDGDSVPELVILTQAGEVENSVKPFIREVFHVITHRDDTVSFTFASKPLQLESKAQQSNVMGQPIFVDLNQEGKLLHLIPYCLSKKCNSKQGIRVVHNGSTVDLPLGSMNFNGTDWGFAVSDQYDNAYDAGSKERFYARSIVLRVGDYNLDGFPDLIGVVKELRGGSLLKSRSVIFENVPCVTSKDLQCPFPRMFNPNFKVLSQYVNSTVATFFDIHEDGLIDVLVVRKKTDDKDKKTSGRYELRAFQNSPDYDSNFIKVMVLTGRKCPTCPKLGIPYGNVIPGPVISYRTKIQSGELQTAVAAQNYRSSHLAMDLPYTIFGIGHSPNFVETLKISMSSNRSHEWPQIIPNSQIIVIPYPANDAQQWKAKLFLTPSDAVKQTFGVLVGILLVVLGIVAGLQFKEWREDKRDRMQEAHRFMM
jgi:integrin alpha FG-GAP repeat containing protein 1